MWTDLFSAIALWLILEGVMPFVHPPTMRRAMQAMSQMPDGSLRFLGLTSMVIGVIVLTWVR